MAVGSAPCSGLSRLILDSIRRLERITHANWVPLLLGTPRRHAYRHHTRGTTSVRGARVEGLRRQACRMREPKPTRNQRSRAPNVDKAFRFRFTENALAAPGYNRKASPCFYTTPKVSVARSAMARLWHTDTFALTWSGLFDLD